MAASTPAGPECGSSGQTAPVFNTAPPANGIETAKTHERCAMAVYRQAAYVAGSAAQGGAGLGTIMLSGIDWAIARSEHPYGRRDSPDAPPASTGLAGTAPNPASHELPLPPPHGSPVAAPAAAPGD